MELHPLKLTWNPEKKNILYHFSWKFNLLVFGGLNGNDLYPNKKLSTTWEQLTIEPNKQKWAHQNHPTAHPRHWNALRIR